MRISVSSASASNCAQNGLRAPPPTRDKARGAAPAAQPLYWGVLELELDEAALAGGVARVSALEAVLPDGLPLRF
ncbi:type VI secretion system baseplate subunit TssK, partial [Chromobacterium haemolyticum]|uniref:type VI secretion system baseplate subunit TssK n=1 Tax=Chromobacterium haemolyticum TaxID=394935 RepID=UPI00351D29F2